MKTSRLILLGLCIVALLLAGCKPKCGDTKVDKDCLRLIAVNVCGERDQVYDFDESIYFVGFSDERYTYCSGWSRNAGYTNDNIIYFNKEEIESCTTVIRCSSMRMELRTDGSKQTE